MRFVVNGKKSALNWETNMVWPPEDRVRWASLIFRKICLDTIPQSHGTSTFLIWQQSCCCKPLWNQERKRRGLILWQFLVEVGRLPISIYFFNLQMMYIVYAYFSLINFCLLWHEHCTLPHCGYSRYYLSQGGQKQCTGGKGGWPAVLVRSAHCTFPDHLIFL